MGEPLDGDGNSKLNGVVGIGIGKIIFGLFLVLIHFSMKSFYLALVHTYIELAGGRSRDECFINVSGNGRTEGEHQHSLGVNYTRVQ